MTFEEKIMGCIGRHPDWSNSRVASAIRGATSHAVQAVREGKPVLGPEQKAPTGTISLEAVRARYDIAAAIRREILRLRPGSLVTETEMRQRSAGKDAARFRRTVENNEEFRANRIKLKLDPDDSEGTWYWATAETVCAAARIRDEI